jgi:MFS superfamily sulfate permease-like transporter
MRTHWLCAIFGALTILLVVLGAGAWALIPAAACAVTCAQMVWGMIHDGHRPVA